MANLATVPDSKTWRRAKSVLRALSVLISIGLVVVSITQVVVTRSRFLLDWLVSVPPVSTHVPYRLPSSDQNGRILIESNARDGYPVHPPTSLSIDLLIWLGSTACLGLLAEMVDWNTSSYSNSKRYKEDGKKEVAMIVFMSSLVLLHFILFVRHCTEVRRRNNTSGAVGGPHLHHVSGHCDGLGGRTVYEKPELDATPAENLQSNAKAADAARIAALEARIAELEMQTRTDSGPHAELGTSTLPAELRARMDPVEMDSTPARNCGLDVAPQGGAPEELAFVTPVPELESPKEAAKLDDLNLPEICEPDLPMEVAPELSEPELHEATPEAEPASWPDPEPEPESELPAGPEPEQEKKDEEDIWTHTPFVGSRDRLA
ncbi:hypothetical protein DL767_006965 [Monosporascus sp. MG133]|nr:hypothetical protein DL767_006965 [Monosporascus sp. MG133]